MTARLSEFAAVRSAFANRNYRIYAAGNAVSLIGLWVQRLAVGWLAWKLTGSGFWLGAVAFADLFPVVVIGPFAGVIADRHDRRRILIAGQFLALVQAMVLFALTVADLITIEILFGLTLCLGAIIAVNQPARLSFVPSLVAERDLPAAVAIGSVIFNLARFVGPAMAGVIITTAGVAPAFAFNAATYGAMIAALAVLRLAPPPPRRRARQSILDEVAAGLRYAFSHPAIAPMLAMMIVASIMVRPVFELLPGFADAVFGRNAEGLAVLTSAVGLGAVAGGVWLAQRGAMRGLTAIVTASMAIAGLVVVVFASTAIFWLGVMAMVVAGAALVAFGVSSQTLIQNAVDAEMRGRVMSLWGLIFRGGPALGALLMGWLSGYFGLALPVLAGGALCAAAGLAVWLRRARLARGLEEPIRHP